MDTLFAAGSDRIEMPAWVRDYESFRRWIHSAACPDDAKVCFIHGKVWVDPDMEEFFSHNVVRTELNRVLANLMRQTKFGRFVSEGMTYSHLETELTTEPDGMIFSHAALGDGRVEDDVQFDVYKRGKKEFVAAKKPGGWVKSAVLGQSFRLTYAEGADGNPEFTLEHR